MAVKQARRGDWRARSWLTAYLLPPVDAVDAAPGDIQIVTYDYMDAVRAIAPVGYDFTRDGR